MRLFGILTEKERNLVNKAITQERERIIKLLEDRTDDSGSVLDETGNSIADLSDLIELIKGETK